MHPTVVVPGFMKAGTTTIHKWLSSQPEFSSGAPKEPNFFTEDDWEQGVGNYMAAIGASSTRTVDSSVRYLDPSYSPLVAQRLAFLNPEVRIIIGFRDPFERAISHIRHDIRKGRIRASTPAEYAELIFPLSIYFERSRYATSLRPFMEYFSPEQIAIICLDAPDSSKWKAIQGHVGLSDRPLLDDVAMNRSGDLLSYSRPMQLIVDAGFQVRMPKSTPGWARALGRRALLREAIEAIPSASVMPLVRPAVRHQLDSEVAEFEHLTRDCAWTRKE